MFSQDFQRHPNAKDQGDNVSLISGARLCSVRNCTFIIPPVDEYRWKTCSLCRLCQKEKVKQNKYGDSTETPGHLSIVEGEELQATLRLIILKALVSPICYLITGYLHNLHIFLE